MKSIMFDRYGKPDVLVEKEVDMPQLRNRMVLVKVIAAGVNPKDCLVRKGKFRLFTGNNFPKQVGYDFSGNVVTVSKEVESVKPGDQVFGMLTGWKGGSYSEYLLASPNELCRKPENLAFEEAAAVPLAAQTALQALRDIGQIKKNDQVCINGGSGGVGTFAIQIAKAFQSNITATCSDQNAELVYRLGADEVINYKQDNILFMKKTFDIVFDVFGNLPFGLVKTILKNRGVYISTIPSAKRIFMDIWHRILPIGKQARLVIVKSKSEDLSALKHMIENGKVKPIVDKIYSLQQAKDAHTYIETKRARGKVVLRIDTP